MSFLINPLTPAAVMIISAHFVIWTSCSFFVLEWQIETSACLFVRRWRSGLPITFVLLMTATCFPVRSKSSSAARDSGDNEREAHGEGETESAGTEAESCGIEEDEEDKDEDGGGDNADDGDGDGENEEKGDGDEGSGVAEETGRPRNARHSRVRIDCEVHDTKHSLRPEEQ